MKRYRVNPDMKVIYGEQGLIHEDIEGPYVKHKDVLEMLKKLMINAKLFYSASYIIDEYGKEFIR